MEVSIDLMLQDKRILRFLTNDAASCNPEPKVLGCVRGGGWPLAVFPSSDTIFIAPGITTWLVKPGTGGVGMFGTGAEDRLPIFLCVGQ